MKNNSIWEQNKNEKIANQNLPDDILDILIIGGGITGLTLAYFLKDSDKRVVLINGNELFNNVTTKSTAKLSFLQRDIYQTLEKYHSYQISKQYYESQLYAISLITGIINDNQIDCDLEESDSYLFTTLKSKIKNLDKEKNLLTSFKRKCIDATALPINFPIEKAFYVKDNYTFNPTKYLHGIYSLINNKIDIFDHVIAQSIISKDEFYEIKTTKGILKSKKVVIANHYPFFIKPSYIPFKNYIKREYICSAKYPKKFKFNAINIDNELHSIRFYKNYLIYVSNDHRLINKIDVKSNFQKSRENFYKNFNLKAEYNWLNQDLMSNDYLPIIGEIKSNLYISTGYNAWGMTNGVLGAKIISDLLLNKHNKFIDLVKPDRYSLVGIVNSIIDSISYIKPYINAPFYNKKIKIEKKNGIEYNVYIDSKGRKHQVKRKCPHLKCNLIFNEEELTWDCPCHGSRFDLDGNLLEGPSKKNI